VIYETGKSKVAYERRDPGANASTIAEHRHGSVKTQPSCIVYQRECPDNQFTILMHVKVEHQSPRHSKETDLGSRLPINENDLLKLKVLVANNKLGRLQLLPTHPCTKISTL
jgi:hypothetical protein